MPSRSRTTSNDRPASAPEPESVPASADRPAAPAATINLPYLSAEVAIPGPGIRVKAGPVNLAIPTRYLYYGGLGALTIAGAVDWPITGALAATGLIISRIRKPAAAEPPDTARVGAQKKPSHR
ncbi:hypothetical protein KO481_12430 [Nocardia sp. NEAU-G5]|uniref:Uncharacterized protein n=1 Tax=Nocardia albiluteola TaxID=2842303 RepID=A0ABS6AWB4_9NOCA|nr:hypothetical protein [Nocardia albiluteola]MBU3062329.1 hypothetical protein [Nocardia albiluteola]